MEKFFGGEAFTTEEIVEGMPQGRAERPDHPRVLRICRQRAGTGYADLQHERAAARRGHRLRLVGEASGEPVEITADPAAPAVAFVFKTVADPFVGKLSF